MGLTRCGGAAGHHRLLVTVRCPLHLLAGVLFLLLILFVMAISCLLGWVAKVSLKPKNKASIPWCCLGVFFGCPPAGFLLQRTLNGAANIALYGGYKVRSSASHPVYPRSGGRRRSPVHAVSDGSHRRAVRPDVAAALRAFIATAWAMWAARSIGPVRAAVRCRAFPPPCWTGSCTAFTSSANYMLNRGFAHCFRCWSCPVAGPSCWSWCRSPSRKIRCRCCWLPSCSLSAMNDTTALRLAGGQALRAVRLRRYPRGAGAGVVYGS